MSVEGVPEEFSNMMDLDGEDETELADPMMTLFKSIGKERDDNTQGSETTSIEDSGDKEENKSNVTSTESIIESVSIIRVEPKRITENSNNVKIFANVNFSGQESIKPENLSIEIKAIFPQRILDSEFISVSPDGTNGNQNIVISARIPEITTYLTSLEPKEKKSNSTSIGFQLRLSEPNSKRILNCEKKNSILLLHSNLESQDEEEEEDSDEENLLDDSVRSIMLPVEEDEKSPQPVEVENILEKLVNASSQMETENEEKEERQGNDSPLPPMDFKPSAIKIEDFDDDEVEDLITPIVVSNPIEELDVEDLLNGGNLGGGDSDYDSFDEGLSDSEKKDSTAEISKTEQEKKPGEENVDEEDEEEEESMFSFVAEEAPPPEEKEEEKEEEKKEKEDGQGENLFNDFDNAMLSDSDSSSSSSDSEEEVKKFDKKFEKELKFDEDEDETLFDFLSESPSPSLPESTEEEVSTPKSNDFKVLSQSGSDTPLSSTTTSAPASFETIPGSFQENQLSQILEEVKHKDPNKVEEEDVNPTPSFEPFDEGESEMSEEEGEVEDEVLDMDDLLLENKDDEEGKEKKKKEKEEQNEAKEKFGLETEKKTEEEEEEDEVERMMRLAMSPEPLQEKPPEEEEEEEVEEVEVQQKKEQMSIIQVRRSSQVFEESIKSSSSIYFEHPISKIVAAFWDKTIRIFDFKTLKLEHTIKLEEKEHLTKKGKCRGHVFHLLKWIHKNEFICGFEDGTIVSYSIKPPYKPKRNFDKVTTLQRPTSLAPELDIPSEIPSYKKKKASDEHHLPSVLKMMKLNKELFIVISKHREAWVLSYPKRKMIKNLGWIKVNNYSKIVLSHLLEKNCCFYINTNDKSKTVKLIDYSNITAPKKKEKPKKQKKGKKSRGDTHLFNQTEKKFTVVRQFNLHRCIICTIGIYSQEKKKREILFCGGFDNSVWVYLSLDLKKKKGKDESSGGGSDNNVLYKLKFENMVFSSIVLDNRYLCFGDSKGNVHLFDSSYITLVDESFSAEKPGGKEDPKRHKTMKKIGEQKINEEWLSDFVLKERSLLSKQKKKPSPEKKKKRKLGFSRSSDDDILSMKAGGYQVPQFLFSLISVEDKMISVLELRNNPEYRQSNMNKLMFDYGNAV